MANLASLVAAEYAFADLSARLGTRDAFLTHLAIGILMTGLVMLKGIFSKGTAYLGLATGILAIISVASSFFASAVSSVSIIIASVLTTAWFLFAGYRLYRLGQQ